MNKTQSCLSREVLDQIGRDEILPNELQGIEDHVSECEHCRDLFAAVTAEPDWSDAILPILREQRGAMPGIVEADKSGGHDSSLKLLGPTDDPHMLGRIGSYEVTGVIGRGGMGIVFKAFDAPLNRFVAIKMMLPHLATSGAARKRFSREGQAAAAVIDDHVLPIYGVHEWQGVPYLVTQYSSGMSLQKRIEDQAPLELKEILRIGLQTARGLAAAHAQGLVHRDVKPSNILLDATVERALLTDFGLARAVDDASITRSGTITGTPQFMAPEQARGESVEQRSDLFSLGAVIYAMCTGHPPFRAETSYGVLRRITDEEPRPIREINSDIPDWLCGIVARLMAKHPGDRFASASELAELLEQCLAHLQQPATVPLPHSVMAATPAANRNRRPPLMKFVAAALFAFSLLFAGVLIVLELNKGTLTIECESDDVPIRIRHGREVVERMVITKSGKSIRVAAGEYVVEIDGDLDGLVVDNSTISLQRGATEIVKICQRIGTGPDEQSQFTAGEFGQPSADAPDRAKGKRLATVCGRPVYEGDLNKNVGDKDNLFHLFLTPLMENYCERQGLSRDAELEAKITDEPTRAVARIFVMRAELNRHLYEKHGGRVQLTAFGPVAVDAQMKWLEDRKRAGDFRITDAKFQEMVDNLWMQVSEGAIFASPSQIEQAFDPSIIERCIDNYAKMSAGSAMTADAIHRELAGLSELVHHDFATDGVPLDRFAVRGNDAGEHVAVKPDGFHVSHPGTDGFSCTSVETLIRVHGNFEVTVSFEGLTFEPGDDGSGGIFLTAILENDVHTHGSVHRGAKIDSLNPLWHFVQSDFVRSPQREPGVVWLGTTAEEATSGRLRLARVGETLYCLFAANESPEFRLIHAERVGPESLLFSGIRLTTSVQSNGSTHGTTSVIWKELTIRAERLTDWSMTR
ncbi:MAG: DUF1583 domain-containing protein [Planctomycetaceae bacterium]|nr:DUF1583 domain-containing protein [Planctomycetaceae bacterium]